MPVVRSGGLARRIGAHATEVFRKGGNPAQAVDSSLVLLMHAGESASLAMVPDGDPSLDPLGVRPIVERTSSWVTDVIGDAPVRPDALRNRSHNLQLMTTRRCQLRCSYCPVVKRDADMPREVMHGAADLLLSTESDRVRLDFTGGEPLMHLDDVLSAAERLLDGASRRAKKASFYMVTNGFLLDVPTARRLADLGFVVELSLDGSREVHNRYKIPVDRQDDPYAHTVAALEAALAAGLPHTVVMVVTPETVFDMASSFDHALSRGARSIDVNYAVGRFWDEASLAAYLDGLTDIVARHPGSTGVQVGNVVSRVEPAVLNVEWMVDTDGSVHLMTEWALEKSRHGAPDLGVGKIGRLTSWDDLYAGRSHAYRTLLATYSWRDGTLRRILHNNVSAGRAVARRIAEIAR